MGSTLIQPMKRGIGKVGLKKLNPSQILFIETIKADRQFNPTNAARVAGYKNPAQAANKLLKNPLIKAAIGKALYERRQKFEVTADRVIQELAAIAFFDPRKLVDECGILLKVKDLPEEVAAAIQSMKVSQGVSDDDIETLTIDYKFWNKVEALTLLVKHLGLEAPTKTINENSVRLDWNSLNGQPDDQEENVIEGQIQKLLTEENGDGRDTS